MLKASILVIFVLVVLNLNNQVYSQPISPNFRYGYCEGESFGNYTTNSTYESNLKSVMSTLQLEASKELFYNTSAGNGTNSTVYGQYYCREDVNSDLCSDCIKEAAVFALNCSNAKAAVIWFNECNLRYANQSMYGIMQDHPALSTWSLTKVNDPDKFFPVLNNTMTSLIKEAAYGNGSTRLFATGEGVVSPFETVYCLVQCSLDLNQMQCEACLQSAYVGLQTCCGEWPTYLFEFPASCQMMYSIDGPFYYTDHNAPPSPPSPPQSPSASNYFQPPPPPPPSPVSVSQPPPPSANGGGRVVSVFESKKHEIVITALVLLMLAY